MREIARAAARATRLGMAGRIETRQVELLLQAVQVVADAALSVCAVFGSSVRSAGSLFYTRASERQMQLFERASRLNADYAGQCVVGALLDGKINLAALLAGEPFPRLAPTA